MAGILIDGKLRECEKSETILKVAAREGIPIPTLCHYPGLAPNNSCMVCLVEDTGKGKLIPACSARCGDVVEIATANPRVIAARRAALELLLSEHLGDCEAPCRRACPGSVEIPGLIRRFSRGEPDAAREVFLEHLPFPGILAEVCPAPCERTCRRGRMDTPISIRGFEAAMAPGQWRGEPVSHSETGRVAVVGAGPAGLAAAYYLRRLGYGCDLYDRGPAPGGELRRLVERGVLGEGTLAAAATELSALGVTFRPNSDVTGGSGIERLWEAYDAVVLATGWNEGERAHEAATGLFLAGDAMRGRKTRLAARSMAEGRVAASAVDHWIRTGEQEPETRRFDSRAGRLSDSEIRAALPLGSLDAHVSGAVGEAGRCLQCDCISARGCSLRSLALEYRADQKAFSAQEREEFERITDPHDDRHVLSYERGKCIRCGICVALSRREGEKPGLALSGRGAGTSIRVPFGAGLSAGMANTAALCTRACPTGALTMYRRDQ